MLTLKQGVGGVGLHAKFLMTFLYYLI